jgi:hypothetical protein
MEEIKINVPFLSIPGGICIELSTTVYENGPEIIVKHIFLSNVRVYCMAACLFVWVLHHTDTVRYSSFTGEGIPRVPFRALFQAQTGTQVGPPTFRKLAG